MADEDDDDVIELKLFGVRIDFGDCIYSSSKSPTKLCRAKLQDGGFGINAVAKVTSRPTRQEAEKLLQCANIHRMLHDHWSILKVYGIIDKRKHFVLLLEEATGNDHQDPMMFTSKKGMKEEMGGKR